MYKGFKRWLCAYADCLWAYRDGLEDVAFDISYLADHNRPAFITEAFCDQHKRRLYTKAPDLYPQFASYGTSDENWYFIHGRIIKYKNGKQII